MIRNEKILITGVTSPIASPVARSLSHENEVWGTARFRNSAVRKQLDDADVRTVPLDLETGDLDTLPNDFSLILHYAHTRLPSGRFHDAIEFNAISAGRVLKHCRTAQAALVLSAATIYSRNADPFHPFVETDDIGLVAAPWAATSPVSKVALEAVSRFCAEAFGIPTTIMRPACPYGTQLDVVTSIIDSVALDRPVHVAHDPQPYSLIHIDDMCRQIDDLISAAAVPARIINWASDEIITTQEIATRTGAIVGVEPRFEIIPAPDIALGGVLDTTLLKSIAGPCSTSFQETFERICRSRLLTRDG